MIRRQDCGGDVLGRRRLHPFCRGSGHADLNERKKSVYSRPVMQGLDGEALDSEVPRQGISNHLEFLEEVGLIASIRRGKDKILEFVGADQREEGVARLDNLTENDIETENVE